MRPVAVVRARRCAPQRCRCTIVTRNRDWVDEETILVGHDTDRATQRAGTLQSRWSLQTDRNEPRRLPVNSRRPSP